MKRLILLAAAALVGFTAVSCDKPDNGNNTGKENEVLKITSSPERLPEAGGKATFTAIFGGTQIVTNSTSFEILNGDTAVGSVSANTFTATGAGAWTIKATYQKVSTEFTITAGDVFFRRVLFWETTYASCPPCATANRYFHETLSADEQAQFLNVALHTATSYDPLYTDAGLADVRMLQATYPSQGTPDWIFNDKLHLNGAGGSLSAINGSSLRTALSTANRAYPAVLGIKATSAIAGDKVTTTAKVKFQKAGEYKVAAVLVQDVLGENLPVTANANMAEYENVFRSHVRCVELGDVETGLRGVQTSPAQIEAGAEETFTFTVEGVSGKLYTNEGKFTPSMDDVSIVIYVSQREGATGPYIINNSLEVPVNGSAPANPTKDGYQYVQ